MLGRSSMLHELDRAVQREILTLTVNGEVHEILVPVHETLLEVLRERLGLTGTKHGCELGECGTCTVLVDRRPILSCLALAVECQDAEIVTVEGLAEGSQLSPLPSWAPRSAGTARRESYSPRRPCWTQPRGPIATRSGRPSPGTSAAARG